MAEYRKVSTALWSSPDFQALGPPPVCLSSLWTYLLMSPAMRMVPGLVLAGPAHIAEEIDPAMEVWTPRAVADLLDELEARGMLRWDRASRVVWLVNALGRPEHVPNANQVIGWRSVFDDVPRSCPFRAELWAAMVEAAGDKAAHLGEAPERFENPSERVAEAFPNGSETVSNSVSVSVAVTPTVAVAGGGETPPAPAAPEASPATSATGELFPAPPPPAPAPPRLSFPAAGRKGGKATSTFDLGEEVFGEMCAGFPSLDVEGALTECLRKVRVQAVRMPTAKGYPAFLWSWLKREADSASSPYHRAQRGAGGPRPVRGTTVVDRLEEKARAAQARAQGRGEDLVEVEPGEFAPRRCL